MFTLLKADLHNQDSDFVDVGASLLTLRNRVMYQLCWYHKSQYSNSSKIGG